MNKHLSKHSYLITNPVELHGTLKKKKYDQGLLSLCLFMRNWFNITDFQKENESLWKPTKK